MTNQTQKTPSLPKVRQSTENIQQWSSYQFMAYNSSSPKVGKHKIVLEAGRDQIVNPYIEAEHRLLVI